MIRKRRLHEAPQPVPDYIIYQQAEQIAALDVKTGLPPADQGMASAGPIA
jgi:hypothetical protein